MTQGGSVTSCCILINKFQFWPHYEPRGQEFESLRARQSDTNLGTPTGAPIFISDTAFSSAAVLPRRVALRVSTRISSTSRCSNCLPYPSANRLVNRVAHGLRCSRYQESCRFNPLTTAASQRYEGRFPDESSFQHCQLRSIEWLDRADVHHCPNGTSGSLEAWIEVGIFMIPH